MDINIITPLENKIITYQPFDLNATTDVDANCTWQWSTYLGGNNMGVRLYSAIFPFQQTGSTYHHSELFLQNHLNYTLIINCIDSLGNSEGKDVCIKVNICEPNWVLNNTWSGCEGGYNYKNYYDTNLCNKTWLQLPDVFKPCNLSIDCIVPYNGLNLLSSFTLCPGTYYITQHINFGKDEININCGNTHLIGDRSDSLFKIYSKSGLLIENCYIENFSKAVFLDDVKDSIFRNNTFINNHYSYYLNLYNYRNLFHENIIKNDGGNAFLVGLSGNNIISNNFIIGNSYGIYLLYSNQNLILNNEFTDQIFLSLYLKNSNKNNITKNNFNYTSGSQGGTGSHIGNSIGLHNSISDNIWNNNFYYRGVYDYNLSQNNYCINCMGNNYYNNATGPICPKECFDEDNDNIQDKNDNCPLIYNSNQKDEDNDNIGDACDFCLNSKQGEPVDEKGCDPFQFCKPFGCSPKCFEMDWRDNEGNYPYDCTVIIVLREGNYSQPICVPTTCCN